MDIRENMGKITPLFIFIPVFFLLLYFELAYAFGFLGNECPIFGTVIYNLSCKLFVWGMFFFGLSSIILAISGRIRLSAGILAVYFMVTFFAAGTWATSEKIIAFAGFVFSVVVYIVGKSPFGSKRSLRDSTALVLFVLDFMFFILGFLTYAVIFRYGWMCSNECPSFYAVCTLSAYIFTLFAILSPLLRVKGKAFLGSSALTLYFVFMIFLSNGEFFMRMGLVLALIVFLLDIRKTVAFLPSLS